MGMARVSKLHKIWYNVPSSVQFSDLFLVPSDLFVKSIDTTTCNNNQTLLPRVSKLHKIWCNGVKTPSSKNPNVIDSDSNQINDDLESITPFSIGPCIGCSNSTSCFLSVSLSDPLLLSSDSNKDKGVSGHLGVES